MIVHFTRARDLVVAGLIGLGAGWLLFQVSYASLPSLPTLAGSTLLILALVEVGLAFWVRGMVRSARVVPDPIVVARVLALAKASSMLGALMAGGWLGAALYLLPRMAKEAPRDDLPSAMIGAVCAMILIAAALWLEQCCRTPDQEDRDSSDDETYR